MKHTSPISAVATFDNKYIATAGYDNRVILWNSNTKSPIARGMHDHLANYVTFSPDGKLLASTSSDATVRIWSVPEMKLIHTFSSHTDDVEMCSFSPCGNYLASASRDCTVQIFNLEKRTMVSAVGHTLDVISVVWNEQGTRIWSSSDDGTMRTWDLDGTCINIEHFDDIQTDTLLVLSDETVILGNDSGELIIISKGTRNTIQAHKAGIKRLIANSKNRVVSLSYDRTMCIWLIEPSGLKLEVSTKFPEIIWPRSAAFLNDEKIVFGSFGDSFAIFNLQSLKWEISHIGNNPGINAVATDENSVYTIGDSGVFYQDFLKKTHLGSLCNFITLAGDLILSGGQMGILFDALSGRELFRFRSPLNCGTILRSNEKTYAYIGTYTGDILIFLIDGNKAEFLSTMSLHKNAIKGIAVGDGLLFSVCADNQVKMHRLNDGVPAECLLSGSHERISNACCFLGAKSFLSVSRDLTLRIWSEQNEYILKSPHKNSIKCVSFNPAQKLICTGTYGGEVGIYDLKSGQWIQHERVSEAGISSLTFDPKNSKFFGSTYGNKVFEIQTQPEMSSRLDCNWIL